jgi:hypothetical protein
MGNDLFGQFIEYVHLYDSGKLWRDQTYKWYELLWRASNQRLRSALAECGFRHDELSTSLAECATRVRERGYETLSMATLQQCLLEWYVWRRINEGEYKTWKYRP